MAYNTIKNFLCLFIMFSLIVSCSDDDNDDTPDNTNSTNKFTIDGTDYNISSALSYTEAFNSNEDIYYFDVAFLSEGLTLTSSNDLGFTGTGDAFFASFINETNTFITEGEYKYTEPADNFFDLWEAGAAVDYNFEESESDEGVFEFDNATINVEREGNIYTFTGSGMTSANVPFTIYYQGSLVRDPDSE